MRTEVEWISINACLEDGVSHTAHLVGGIIGALAACCPLGECLENASFHVNSLGTRRSQPRSNVGGQTKKQSTL